MSEKFSGEEVSKRALDILQSSVFTETLESFNAKCIRPTMNIMAKKIVTAKKKLKKLQKRQRKQVQYAQGVTQKFSIKPPVMPKITEEMMDAIRSRYHIVPRDVDLGDIKEANAHDCLVKANKTLDDVINAPVNYK